VNGTAAATIVGLAASVERRSTHPIALAILHYADAARLAAVPADGVTVLAGRGAEGRVDGHRVLLGNRRLFEERRLLSPEIEGRLEAMAAAGRTPVLVARDEQPIGILAVADRPRESAKATVDLSARTGRAADRHADRRQSGDRESDRGGARRRRIPGGAPAGGQGRGGRGAAPDARVGGDGRGRRERRAGAGGGRCRDRDGRRGKRTPRSRPPTSH